MSAAPQQDHNWSFPDSCRTLRRVLGLLFWNLVALFDCDLCQNLSKYFNFFFFQTLILVSAIVEAQILIGCVVFKHQAIAQVLNKHVVSKKIRLLRKSSYVFVPGSAFLTFLQGSTRREDQLKFIESRYPKYLSEFKNLSNFAIYQFNIWHVFLAGIGIVGGIFCAVTGVYTTVDIFKMLREVQTKVSSSSFQRNQSAIRSLVSQMLASLMFFVPLFFFVMLIMSDMDNGQCEFFFLNI